MTLESLYDISDHLDGSVGQISTLFNELTVFGDEFTMYDQFLAQAQDFKVTIDRQIEALEEEEDQKAEQMMAEVNRQMEEETRILLELIRERAENPIYATT